VVISGNVVEQRPISYSLIQSAVVPPYLEDKRDKSDEHQQADRAQI
jgi:hypothetical protein